MLPLSGGVLPVSAQGEDAMRLLVLAAAALAPAAAFATPTENRVILVLPAPGAVVVDAKTGDWDLSGGIFCSDDVEKTRDEGSFWFHVMYDARNLYVLAHVKDPTPLDNYRPKAEGSGYLDDCLQFRLFTDRACHVTGWRDRNGVPVMDIVYGSFEVGEEGRLPDAFPEGAQMAFALDEDRKGYVQEIALPWKLISRAGEPLAGGQSCSMTAQCMINNAWTVGDLYAPNADRGMAFFYVDSWGAARFLRKGTCKPVALRLADGRELHVAMAGAAPKVDWSRLSK